MFSSVNCLNCIDRGLVGITPFLKQSLSLGDLFPLHFGCPLFLPPLSCFSHLHHSVAYLFFLSLVLMLSCLIFVPEREVKNHYKNIENKEHFNILSFAVILKVIPQPCTAHRKFVRDG